MKPFWVIVGAAMVFTVCVAVRSVAAEEISRDLPSLTQDGRGWEIIDFPRFASSFAREAEGRRAIRPANLSGAYLADFAMGDGVIEVELKGYAQDQSGFIGVLFSGVDETTHEGIYFRPFNFGHADAVKRAHAVQYIAMPEWPWHRLRRERPDQFEQPVRPEPASEAWFRARIVVAGEHVRVFVNDATEPSLDVVRLTDRRRGKVGIFVNGVGNFAGFRVRPAHD